MRGFLTTTLAGLVVAGCSPSEGETRAVRLLGVQVVDDANDDGRLNPGESARLRVEIQVDGEPASLECAVTSETPGIDVAERDDTLHFFHCADACADAVAVEASAQVPPGTRARFRCEPAEGGGFGFEVAVEAADVALTVDRTRITDDSNGDGVLNPGETAEFRVGLRNDGTAAVTRTRCIVGALTEGVEVVEGSDSLDYFHCGAGADCGESSFRVAVDPGVAPGTVAGFACALVDREEATWSFEVRARVEASAARPVFDGYRTEDDEPLAPGYQGALRIRLQNVGPSALSRAGCTVDSDADWLEVTAHDDALMFFACGADSECGEDGIRVRVVEDAPPGGRARLTCDLTDAQEQVWPLSLVISLVD